MVIRATDRISKILAEDEHLIDVFVSISPEFERLRSPGMGDVMGRLVTVAQAAKIAGTRLDGLLKRLNEAAGAESPLAADLRAEVPEIPGRSERPELLDDVPSGQLVELDVREDLRQGKEPFGRIMAARRGLQPGNVLRLRATFEPVPLYAVMAKQGLMHWTERLADDDWRVWFYEEGPVARSAASPRAAESPMAADDSNDVDDGHDGPIVVLDVRGLEPPEPMVRTLAALEKLPADATLLQINVRVPQFLIPRLEELGFEYEIRQQNEDLVRVFIRHGEERRAAQLPSRQEIEMPNQTGPIELDVRVIPPREKHPTIFQTFESLAPGESFVLVNDHDPFPLRYQFEAERAGAFEWTYLETGPTVWRVEIGRK